MKQRLYLLLVLLCTMMSASDMQAQEKLPAFPGADGYGKYTTGGRGGEVCYVTRNDDCNDNNLVEGTLRWALRHDNGGRPRTILFATSGTIYLTSKLKMQYSDVSILGQTAPGGGITITGYPLYICKNNVIIRYVRFRAGDIPDESLTGLDMENCDNVILDHCSMTWSMEECLTAYDTDYTTVQWCIIGEALYNSKNSKGARAYAMQWGGEHSTMHHTLITNSMSRSPRFNGVRSVSNNPGDHDRFVDSEFANNVLFNWGTNNNGSYGGENNPDCKGYNRVYLINNYWRPGPNAGSNRYFTTASSPYGEYYLSGNKFELSSKHAPSSTAWSDTELAKVNADNLYGAIDKNANRGFNFSGSADATKILNELPYALSGLTYETADEAFQSVTTKAGASLPRYDEVDTRLLAEAAGTTDPKFKGGNNKLGVIDSPNDVTLSYSDTYIVNGVTYNNMPRMFVEGQDKYMVDSDADGMPDAYEDEVGLNKNDASDGTAVAANGYTNLEVYLNGVADGTISKTKYETSSTYVEPGPEVVAPETVTVIYKVDDTAVEGTVPAQTTGSYGTDGRTVTIPTNKTLYKEGHTLTGWTAEGKVYTPGQSVVFKKETVTLTAIFTKNKVDMADRTSDVIVTWNVITDGIDITGSGIYVTQATFAGAPHDVKLSYDNSVLTIPTCAGATVKIEARPATSAKEDIATGDTYVHKHETGKLASITVVMPFDWNTPDRVYYTPEIPAGGTYQIVYTTPDNVKTLDWIEASYLDYPNDRTFFDPEKDDNITCYFGKAIVVNNSDRTMDMFVTGTEKMRVFVTSQSSNQDFALVTATPADGGEAVTMQSAAFEHKQDPKVVEIALDKTKKYRVQVMSVNGNDVAVGAIKFVGEAPAVTEGDANITWQWTDGTASENGKREPATMFTSATATVSATFNQESETRLGETFAKVSPKSGVQSATRVAEDNITFDIQPATGVYFLPQNISFHSLRFGTGSILLDVTVQQGAGEEITVLNGFKPNNVNETISNVDIDLTTFDKIISTTEPMKMRIYVYDVFPGKFAGFNNIKVSGKFSGTAPELPKYSFNATVSPAGAAQLSWAPEGTTFDEGTEVSLILKGNSNYLFENWTDQNGNIVSTKENFNYTVKGNTELTANYKSYDDYGHIFNAVPYDAAVKTINELKVALAKANSRTDMTQRYRIFLHNGTYDYGTSAKNEVKGNISLIGESQDGVIITNKPVATGNWADNTPTLFIDQNQNDVYMQDLTVRQGRDWDSKKSTGQAMAIRQRGKHAVYKNVTLQGIQDTYYLNKGDATAYFETSTIAGQTDYIYGDGIAWFERCNMYNTGAGYIMALNTPAGGKGMVLNECTVDGDASAAGKYYLGRPWNDSPHGTYLNTTFNQLPKEEGWGAMTSGLVVRYHEYGSKDAEGRALDLSKRSIAACNAAADSYNPVMTAEEAAVYTTEYMFGDWNPQALTVQLAAPAVTLADERTISWTPVADALGYAIVKDGSVAGFTTATTFDISAFGAGTYGIRVANECGGLGTVSGTVTGIDGITADDESTSDAPRYNISGQRVGKTFKGIVIQNGKKKVVK